MILKYRVSLAGIKGFARVYALSSATTLYDFHKLLQEDLEFPADQLIQFKALDEVGGLVARWGMFDLGAGTVDAVSLAETLDKGVASFQYFYDVANRKSVIITLEGEIEPEPGLTCPSLLETKGPVPVEFENGYVAYEDLPEDQKRVHEDPHWNKSALPAFPRDKDDEEDDFADDEEDEDDLDEADDPSDEDGQEIFDGSEELI